MVTTMNRLLLALTCPGVLALPHGPQAREYYLGGLVQVHDMEIVANYLTGIEMAPTPPNMAMGSDAIHLEADVHATADYRRHVAAVVVRRALEAIS